MTFDEAIEHFRNNTDISGTAVFLNDVEDTLKELREEYAPTILLTKNQYKEFKAGHTLEEVIARMQRLADNSSDESADGYINDDMIMRSYLHPETIKIVDE